MIDANLVFNAIMALVNVILVIFIYLQFRDSRMPNLTTEIVSYDGNVRKNASVLETGTLYLILTNKSKNVAKKVNIKFIFRFKGIEHKSEKKVLSHLNGGESLKVLVYFGEILKKYPDLFEEHTIRENQTWITPKEMLKIDLQVIITNNGIIGNVGAQKLEDNYYIEWWEYQEEHKRSYEVGNLPTFFSWNRRDGEFNIYKSRKEALHDL